jgi:adenine-specific DNA-methyltransferase
MTVKKGKLELTWVGKDERVRLEPRVLVEDPVKSYGDPKSENILIFGDNLLALKALEQEFAGKIKCAAFDPPYNTGSAFDHYDDGVEHSIWLSLMRDRLVITKNLLSTNGSLWITIDDNEAHYLKIICDEIFGRNNFVADVIWEKSDSPRMDAVYFSNRYDHLLVYAKDKINLTIAKTLNNDENLPEHYNKIDKDGRKYYLKPLRAMGGQGDSRLKRPTLYYELIAPDATKIFPKKQDGTDGAWRWNKEKVQGEMERIDWVKGRTGWTPYFRIYADTGKGRPPETIWTHTEAGSNRTSKAEIKELFNDENAFDTPKPEKLIKKIFEHSTNLGDLVLDSFAGSGTTGAVAHKMGRRWIMCELGEHCHTHIIPRMKKVIDGTDQGGISESVNWKGGGGFKYYHLAESLLVRDKELSTKDHPVYTINPRYNEQMLIKAICKIENFKYRNRGRLHGISSESRFLHVTTRLINQAYIDSLAEDLALNQSLLIYSTRRMRGLKLPDNIELKKIPRDLLEKCDFQEDKK